MKNNIYETAKKYAALGLCVIPIVQKSGDVDISKVPAGKALKKVGSVNSEGRGSWTPYRKRHPTGYELKVWFNGRPSNLALLGGKISGNILWLDFDDADAYGAWAAEYPAMGNAPTQTTGQGYHIGVRTSDPTPGSQDLYYNGVHIGETRGEGGYIIVAPSVHGSGRLYEWLRPPWDFDFLVIDDLADIGLMTKDKMRKSSNVGKQAREDRRPKIQATIGTALRHLATAIKGQRNTTLNETAYTLAGFIQSGEMSRNEIEQMLMPIALAIGLTEREIQATINSGLNAGITAPLDEPDNTTPGDTAPPDDLARPDLLPFPAADEGNAQAVLLLHGDEYLYTNELGWLWYNGKHWGGKGSDEHLNRAIVATLIERRTQGVAAELEPIVQATKPSAANVRNCKYMLQSLLWISIDDFDFDSDLLNCTNGVVNLETGELAPHDHTQHFTYCINTAYDPQVDDTQWANWVYNTLTPAGCDDDGRYADLAAWLQMAVGYSLTGHTHEQCLFYLQGPPRAGKGVFLQTLDKMLGCPLSSGVDFDTFTDKRGGDNQNFDLAPLKACRLITASESKRTTMLNAQRVKSITGADPVYCAHKRKDFFSYTPQYKIWLASNFKVMAQADDDALWSRLRIINFPNSHLGNEDFGLEARLWNDRKGILKWAIDGAKSWYRHKAKNIGLGRPDIITNTVQTHRDENDTVAQFIDDCCIIGPDQYTVGAQLTTTYRDWCNENGFPALGGRRLGEALRRKGYTHKQKKVASKNAKCWTGLGLEH